MVAFVSTADPARSRAFYADVLGLRLVCEDAFACVYACGGTTLRIAAAPEVVAAPYTVLGWGVPDARATVRELERRGVVFERYDALEQDELGVWRSPAGADVAWFRDPDGNLLSVTAAPPADAEGRHGCGATRLSERDRQR